MKKYIVPLMILLMTGRGGAEPVSQAFLNVTVDNALIVKVSPWVDIRAFGAKGDSKTDDSAAVNAAIASLPAEGGEVYIPNGNFRLANSIRINKSYVTIVGNGQGSLLWADRNVVAIRVAPDANVQNVYMKNFCVYGRPGAAGGIRLGTNVHLAAFIKIEDLGIALFHSLNGYGISLESVQEVNIVDTALYQNYNNIFHPITGFVTSTTVQGNKGYVGWAKNKGIVLEGSVASFYVNGIVIEGNEKGAFSSTGWLSNITIENCHFEANGNKGGAETVFVSSNSSTTPSKIRLLNNFFYGDATPILRVDNVIDSKVANNWGLFGAANSISTTPNSHVDFSMNRSRLSDDVIKDHLSRLPGHISARETDRASGNVKEYGSRIFTTKSGYLALENTRLRSTQPVPPSVTVHRNSGAGAAGNVSSATDLKGQLTLTTGSGRWAAGEQARVNFSAPYDSDPVVLLVPQNANASQAQKDRQVNVTSGRGYFAVVFDTADTSSKTYKWNYLVVE